MPIVISVPDNLKPLADAFANCLARAERQVARAAGGRCVDYAAVERELAADAAAVERAMHQVSLQALDINVAEVRIGGDRYRRVGRGPSTYHSLAGDVGIEHTLYRKERNGKTVDPVSIRAGVLGAGWLPETACAIAHLAQQGHSREAESTAGALGRLPYSRSSFERVGHDVGRLFSDRKREIEDSLIVALQVPEKARSMSFSLDRVSLPMEEPKRRPAGRPRKNAPKRPVDRVYRMAYCSTVTLHDKDGEALHTIRYGGTPNVTPEDLCDRLLADAVVLLAERPDLQVVLLADGAHEMWNLLTAAISKETLGVEVYELIDFWHLQEKLAAAAAGIHDGDAKAAVLGRWRLRLVNSKAGAQKILNELRASNCEHVRVGDARPVHDAITYLENHAHRLDYRTARKHGLPIGSGIVEATCKTLIEVRMKRAGFRWKEPTAANIINLRALALSDRWTHAMMLTMAPLRRTVRPCA